MLEMVIPSDEPTEKREQCQDHQRHKHDHRALVRLAMAMRIVPVGAVSALFSSAIVAEKRHVQQAEHVERSDERRNHADSPVHPTNLVSFPENFVLAPESR